MWALAWSIIIQTSVILGQSFLFAQIPLSPPVTRLLKSSSIWKHVGIIVSRVSRVILDDLTCWILQYFRGALSRAPTYIRTCSVVTVFFTHFKNPTLVMLFILLGASPHPVTHIWSDSISWPKLVNALWSIGGHCTFVPKSICLHNAGDHNSLMNLHSLSSPASAVQ